MDTARVHEALDTSLSVLDLTDSVDLARFLRIHHAAFAALSTASQGETQVELADLAERALADLGTLGVEPLSVLGAGRLDPVATAYVLQGSRLGTKVLGRRWEAGTDPVARSASAYFSAPHDPAAWRALCADLEARPAEGPEADCIVGDAIRIFDLFRAALTLSSDTKGRHVA